MENTPETKGRYSLFSKLAILVVLLILGVALFGEKGVVRLVKLMRESEALREEVQALKDDNAQLREEIEALRSDHRYLEQLARRELGMVREDEIIYQFRPAKETSPEESAAVNGEH